MYRHIIFLITLSCVGAAGLLCAPLTHAATSVSNSASVSATAESDGKSTNTIRVHSVVNGEVVEDVDETSSEPIKYHSRTMFSNGTTTVTASSDAPLVFADQRQAQLQALLIQLLHYVSLLKQALEEQ